MSSAVLEFVAGMALIILGIFTFRSALKLKAEEGHLFFTDIKGYLGGIGSIVVGCMLIYFATQ